MASNKLILKNTLLLYFRQILIIFINLYAIRIILNTLGVVDYGIYNVIAGVITSFNFVMNSMATASQRYFSYELGKNNFEQLNRTFTVTFKIYGIIALVFIILGETFGIWFIQNKLVIPLDRLKAALILYQFSMLSFLCNIMTAPYMADIIARENMDIYAYMSIIEAVLKLIIVYLLKISNFDKLVLYGFLLFITNFINTLLYRTYCKWHYKESNVTQYWNKNLGKELLSYIGYNLFGSAASIGRDQGITFILNIFFGPTVNAARGIATQVSGVITSFSTNFLTAVKPGIIKTYSQNKKDELNLLVNRSCKLSVYLLLYLEIPFIFECEKIMKLWLQQIPDYVVVFTQIVLLENLINAMSGPLMILAQATGNIKWYQIVVGSVVLLYIPAVYIGLILGCSVVIVLFFSLFFAILATIVRIVMVKRIAYFSVKKFFLKVVFPVTLVSMCSFFLPLFCIKLIPSSVLRIIVTIIVSILSTTFFILTIGISKDERFFLKNKIHFYKERFIK
jgi:O-antigen/teichoic acid export membrane protein